MILATTWAGTLPAWLLFVVALAGIVLFKGSPPAAALEIAQRSNTELARRVDELEKAQKLDRATIAILTAKTDISLAIQPLIDWCQAHERLAQARADEIMLALAKVA